MVSLLGGIAAIVLGIVGLAVPWFGQRGIIFLLKGLVATVPALLVLGGCVAIGAGIGSVKDKMKEKEEKKPEGEKTEEKKTEEKVEEKVEEKKEEKTEEK